MGPWYHEEGDNQYYLPQQSVIILLCLTGIFHTLKLDSRGQQEIIAIVLHLETNIFSAILYEFVLVLQSDLLINSLELSEVVPAICM